MPPDSASLVRAAGDGVPGPPAQPPEASLLGTGLTRMACTWVVDGAARVSGPTSEAEALTVPLADLPPYDGGAFDILLTSEVTPAHVVLQLYPALRGGRPDGFPETLTCAPGSAADEPTRTTAGHLTWAVRDGHGILRVHPTTAPAAISLSAFYPVAPQVRTAAGLRGHHLHATWVVTPAWDPSFPTSGSTYGPSGDAPR